LINIKARNPISTTSEILPQELGLVPKLLVPIIANSLIGFREEKDSWVKWNLPCTYLRLTNHSVEWLRAQEQNESRASQREVRSYACLSVS